MKINKKFIAVFMSGVLFGVALTMIVSNYNDKPDIMEQHEKLLDDIYDSLFIEDGKYVYNYDIIRNLVYEFDIYTYNAKMDAKIGSNVDVIGYTHDVFLKNILDSIDAYRFPNRP